MARDPQSLTRGVVACSQVISKSNLCNCWVAKEINNLEKFFTSNDHGIRVMFFLNSRLNIPPIKKKF